MNFKEYQNLAMRTRDKGYANVHESLVIGALGISGEAGEVTDYIKKVVYHRHELDKDKLVKEIGDVMWYMALLAEALQVDLEDIAIKNIEKLKLRYPEGFSIFDSIRRIDEIENENKGKLLNIIDWDHVKNYLMECKTAYSSIGSAGNTAIIHVINPLIIRFNRGERTEDLFNEIMDIKL